MPFKLNAAILYPIAVSCAGEVLVSLKRIENFLLKEEKNENEIGVERQNSDILQKIKSNAIELSKVSARWDRNSNLETLSEIDLKIKTGEICAVIGPVGGGKVKKKKTLM